MTRPAPTEFAPFYAAYVARVPEIDPLPALEAQPAELLTIADRIAPEDESFRYDPTSGAFVRCSVISSTRSASWGIACIASREARRSRCPDSTRNEYVANADSEDRPVKELAHEFAAVRHANLWGIRRWTDEHWGRVGNANGYSVTARAIAYIMVGHVRHHWPSCASDMKSTSRHLALGFVDRGLVRCFSKRL